MIALKIQRFAVGSERRCCRSVLIPAHRRVNATRSRPECVTYQRPSIICSCPASTDKQYCWVSAAKVRTDACVRFPHLSLADLIFLRNSFSPHTDLAELL